ncbi:MAG: fumarylacetoacetate hydrolase family protein [Halobacteriales archaeon]
MRIARTPEGPVVGDGEGFVPLSSAAPTLDTVADAVRAAPDGLRGPAAATATPVPGDALTFASPVPERRKLWGIGLNYLEHAGDLSEERPEEPASFMKPATALRGPGGPIRLPPEDRSERVTAEGELAVVIGRTCTDVPVEDAPDVIAGYLPVIDMTAEDVLERNPRFLTRAKSFDSFLVAGPWIRTADTVGALADLTVRTVIDDEAIAENRVGNMAFPPAELVSFHSRVMTLEPGDLISTGTPGAGVIDPGSRVRAEVEDVGSVAADVVR